VRDGVIDLPRLMAMLSTNPARIIGVEGGSLSVGSAADLMIFTPETPWRISGEGFAAAASNTPFDGLPTQGRVRSTIKGGRLLA
jgi:dihydroorotase